MGNEQRSRLLLWLDLPARSRCQGKHTSSHRCVSLSPCLALLKEMAKRGRQFNTLGKTASLLKTRLGRGWDNSEG